MRLEINNFEERKYVGKIYNRFFDPYSKSDITYLTSLGYRYDFADLSKLKAILSELDDALYDAMIRFDKQKLKNSNEIKNN